MMIIQRTDRHADKFLFYISNQNRRKNYIVKKIKASILLTCFLPDNQNLFIR